MTDLQQEVLRLRRRNAELERRASDAAWQRDGDRMGGSFNEADRAAYERGQQGTFG